MRTVVALVAGEWQERTIMNTRFSISIGVFFCVVGLSQFLFLGLERVEAADQKEKAVTKEEVLKELKNVWYGKLKAFKSDRFLEVGEHLQFLGKKEACECLAELGSTSEDVITIVIFCRMLFHPPEKRPMPELTVGDPRFLGRTNKEHWPLEPIEIIDGVPFLIVRSYITGTFRVDAGKRYVDWYVEHWHWRESKYSKKSEKQKEVALEKLISKTRWVEPLSSYERAFLVDQIK
jgi:hypothetical protein